ncbi:ATP-binding protein [Methanofollis fontis]|uniref:YhaN AAA domain-containing protein n=1 Tax=Methanofollis fontis TaxID=2052832 RepID=A0A483CLV8_9EURY|nr:AAA family ATPase [Methanofollis fontis]TAJ43979.1 hypothetical protein CUJ86_07995 [Methanofollis fontis]
MKIEEIYVDGFGHFHNTKLDVLSPHLTVITGPNEAGKSTLLEFIRRMLFGFPSRKQGQNSYPPLNGGDMGGWLRLTTPEEGTVLLERSDKRAEPSLVSVDGSPAGCTLPDLIGTADRQFFENVYAFGIGELNDIKSLSAGSIQSRVMSAGIGITRGSIADVRAQVHKDRDALFKPGRAWKDIRIKEIFSEITGLEKTLRQCRGTQEEYDCLQIELKELESTLADLKKEEKRLRQKMQDAENLLSVWEDWVGYTETKRRLSDLPTVAPIPEGGVQILRGFDEKAEELEEELKACRRNLQQDAQDLEGCTVDEVVCVHADAIHELENGLKKYLADLGAYDEAVRETEKLTQEVDALARQVGLQGEALAFFDVSARTRQQVEDFRTHFSDLNEEARTQTSEGDRLDGEKRGVQAKIQTDEATLSALSVTGTMDGVQKKRAALDDLSVEVPAWSKAKDELDRLIEKEAEIGTRLKQDAAARGVSLPRWPALMIVAAGVVALVGGVMMDSIIVGGGLFLLMLVIAGIYLRGVTRETPVDIPAGDDVLDMARVRQGKETDLAEREVTLRNKAKECGFSTIPDLSAINTMRSKLDGEVHTLQERERLEKALQVSRKTYADHVADLERVQADIDANAEEKKETLKEWQAWLEAVSLDTSLTPEVVLDIIPTIEKAQDRIRARDAAGIRCADLKETIVAYDTAAGEVAVAIGADPAPSVEVQVQNAVASLKEQIERKRQHDTLVRDYARIQKDEKSIIEKMEDVARKRADLFSGASVTDEESFLNHTRIQGERIRLAKEEADAELRLKKAAGGERAFPAFVTLLQNTERTDLAETVKECRQRLDEITPEGEKKRERRGRLLKEIEELEEDNHTAAEEAKLRCLHEDITEVSRAWAVRVIADHLLNQAIEKYEKERQPAVILEATRYFSGITGGRYQKIYRPIDAEAVVVEERNGKRKEISDLSLGTAQQLYLALRFGYITEFSKHDAVLPVVFDDVLVNFDPVRKRRGCQAIADLAGKTQVLYFTCHPETVALLTEARPDVRIIDLGKIG